MARFKFLDVHLALESLSDERVGALNHHGGVSGLCSPLVLQALGGLAPFAFTLAPLGVMYVLLDGVRGELELDGGHSLWRQPSFVIGRKSPSRTSLALHHRSRLAQIILRGIHGLQVGGRLLLVATLAL